MSRLQEIRKRSENARDLTTRAIFAFITWMWVLQLIIPWWETWRETSSQTVRAVITLLTLVFIATYTYVFYRLNFRRRSWTEIFTVRERWAVRGITAGTSLILTLWQDDLWAISLTFVAITLVLTAPPLQANRAAYAGIILALAVLVIIGTERPFIYAVMAPTVILTFLVAWQMRQGGMIGKLIEGRYNERRMAAAEERLRIARDLHDTLGHTLSLITLKSELANRLLDADPEMARREMRDVEQLARSAMGDVRRTVSDERKPILTSELADARQLLDAAGIGVAVDGEPAALPEEIASLFAWGVREGVTNVVRHSRANRCAIRLWHDGDTARLSVTDDGAGSASPGSGTGLASLRERAAELGGSLAFDVLPDGSGHRLCLTVPMSDRE